MGLGAGERELLPVWSWRSGGLGPPVAQAAARWRLDSDPGSGGVGEVACPPPPSVTHLGKGPDKWRGGGLLFFRVLNITVLEAPWPQRDTQKVEWESRVFAPP